ncbi:hypothetical protein J5W64_04445 [Candidatus Akkermansia timonensis]|nr:hypothetical protein [Candidatus Akkermansia timonensis]QWO91666.1 hypothetical protein J5W64_04445 [Candidatus Akkermansia timonensis]
MIPAGTCTSFLLPLLLLVPCVCGQEAERGESAPPAAAHEETVPLPVPDTDHLDDSSDRPVLQGRSNVAPVAEPVPAPAAPSGEMSVPPAAAPATEAPVRRQPFTSISSSKQFHVIGQDALLAGAIASRADSMRTALLKILKQPNEWKNRIIIRLLGEPGTPVPPNPIRMQTTILGDAITYNIYIHLGRGINQDRLRNAVISTLLYEMMLRNIDPEGLPEQVSLPAWLITGLEQAVLWQTNEADRTLYSTLFQQDGIMSPDDILKSREPEKELDATSYAAYQTSCGALMLCLLNQKNGPEGMKQLLDQAILGGGRSQKPHQAPFSPAQSDTLLPAQMVDAPAFPHGYPTRDGNPHDHGDGEAFAGSPHPGQVRSGHADHLHFSSGQSGGSRLPDGPEETAFQHIRQPVQPQQALVPLLSSRHRGIRQARRPDADGQTGPQESRAENQSAPGNTGTFHENGPARTGLYGLV